ncbi:T6SS immunity protein Tli4 family protein [Massilia horti]|uniref:Uncharacterized protein n=1 Tax=Massilia horti TaxID=2562153 RepID=A0A4Y9SX90_9BURK|nr:T6SS immunity protein Tli4 family protein [Massilia horti]TFW29959.1 hypothetical protein E4O92_17660 [Massilia horti]
MKRFLQKKWFRVLAVVVGAAAVVWMMGALWDMYAVAKMTKMMKTVCVGRMLIDLPQEAKVELGHAFIDGFYIDAIEESAEAFANRLAAREAAIRAKPDRFGGNDNMESIGEVKTDNGLVGEIFVHERYVTEGTEGYSHETLRRCRYEGIALEGHVHGNGISIDLEAKDYDPALFSNLTRLIAQLVPNPGNRIPTEPGFCFDLAYFRDPLTADQGEEITMAAKLPSRPDIGLTLDSKAGIKPDPDGLLKRNEAAHARAPLIVNLAFTNVRAAPRTIGGLTGDELVESVLEPKFTSLYGNSQFYGFARIHGFNWEVNGTKGNVFVPHLTLTMATGRSREGPIESSLSLPAALSLWDKIASSIRIRPASR